MMKVLFVSSLPSYYTHENSSYMQRLHFLKEGLTNLGVHTDFISLGDLKFGKPALISPLTFRKININIDDYDFVHAGGLGAAYALSLIKLFSNFQSKIIYDVHGDVIAETKLLKKHLIDIPTYYKILQAIIMEHFARRNCDFFITCSKPLKNLYMSKGIETKKIVVIYNGIDIEFFKPLNLKKHENNFVVTYAGGFQRYQGIELLINAAEKIEDRTILFQIIGFREETKFLKNQIKERLNNRVKLIDAVSREELLQYLNISDILVIPREEHKALEMAFPTKFAEFISTGNPVLLTDVAEVAQLVKKYHCGYVCEPSYESLAESILKMRNLNSEKLAFMGKNGNKLAKDLLNKDIISHKYYGMLKYWKKLEDNNE